MSEGHPSLGAVAGSATLPTPLAPALGKQPILKTESTEDFNWMFNRFATRLQPRDDIEVFSVWCFTIKSWEILRYYRIRTGIVDMARNRGLLLFFDRVW